MQTFDHSSATVGIDEQTQFQGSSAHQFRLLVPGKLGVGIVDFQEQSAVGIRKGDGVGGKLEQQRELFLGLTQPLLGALAFRDISKNPLHAENRPRLITVKAARRGHEHGLAILALQHHLEIRNHALFLDAFQKCLAGGGIVPKFLVGSAEHLLHAIVAEQADSRRAEHDQPALGVGAVKDVMNVVDHGSIELLACAQGLLGPFALRVVENQGQHDLPALQVYDFRRPQGRAHIPGSGQKFDGKFLEGAVPEQQLYGVVPLLRIGPDADLLGCPADLLLLGVAEHFHPARIDVDEPSGGDVGNDQRGRAGMKGLGEALLALAQQFLGLLALGNVPSHPDNDLDLPAGAQDGGIVPGQPAPAVHGHGALLHVGRVRRDEKGLHGLLRRLTIVFMDQGHESHTQELLFGTPENAAVARACVQEPSLGIDLDHEVGLVLDEKTIFVLPLQRSPSELLQFPGRVLDSATKAKVPDHGGGQYQRKAHNAGKKYNPHRHGRSPLAAGRGGINRPGTCREVLEYARGAVPGICKKRPCRAHSSDCGRGEGGCGRPLPRPTYGISESPISLNRSAMQTTPMIRPPSSTTARPRR
jgi:hypothetical protein